MEKIGVKHLSCLIFTSHTAFFKPSFGWAVQIYPEYGLIIGVLMFGKVSGLYVRFLDVRLSGE